MERLNTFRLNRELCDVVLFVKEHEIHAHKIVLASLSNALFDMFQKETEDAVTNNHLSTEGINFCYLINYKNFKFIICIK